eukprot:9909988-Ditylum_brightwellii.AAC.1
MMVELSSKFYAVRSPTKVNNKLKTVTRSSNTKILKPSSSPTLSPDAQELENMLIVLKNEVASSQLKAATDPHFNLHLSEENIDTTLTPM